MKPYSIFLLLCLIAFMICKNQFTSGRKKTNLRALRPTSLVNTRKNPKHTTNIMKNSNNNK